MNALIEKVFIGLEDHGILTFYLHMKLQDGCCQAFGGYPLERNSKMLTELLQVLDKRDFNKLHGTAVRVEHNNGLIVSVGHIVEDKWLRIP